MTLNQERRLEIGHLEKILTALIAFSVLLGLAPPACSQNSSFGAAATGENSTGSPLRLAAQNPATAPRLQVTVDARVELLRLIFRLAGNPEYRKGRIESYNEDIEN